MSTYMISKPIVLRPGETVLEALKRLGIKPSSDCRFA